MASHRPASGGATRRPSGRAAATPPLRNAASINNSANVPRKIVGQYMIGKTIGEGTFGKVKIGIHLPTGEKVAVKILEKCRIKEQADVRRVNREIKILKKAQHENVIRLYEVLDTSNAVYLIMENCDGGEMFDYIVAHRHVAEKQACTFFHQIIDGLESLHKHEITHRDLKPENLLLKLAPDGWVVKIVDFGLSNTHDGGRLLSTACGSPCYAAPEMIAGRKYEGPLADLWSCGVILFALVCGFLPFEDPNTSALYQKILSGVHKPAKWVSPEARDLIRRLLEVNPNKRYRIADIRKHPWYAALSDASIPKDCFSPAEADATREEILKQLGTTPEVDVAAVKEGLSSRVCNAHTAMYHLLEQKAKNVLFKQRVDSSSKPLTSSASGQTATTSSVGVARAGSGSASSAHQQGRAGSAAEKNRAAGSAASRIAEHAAAAAANASSTPTGNTAVPATTAAAPAPKTAPPGRPQQQQQQQQQRQQSQNVNGAPVVPKLRLPVDHAAQAHQATGSGAASTAATSGAPPGILSSLTARESATGAGAGAGATAHTNPQLFPQTARAAGPTATTAAVAHGARPAPSVTRAGASSNGQQHAQNSVAAATAAMGRVSLNAPTAATSVPATTSATASASATAAATSVHKPPAPSAPAVPAKIQGTTSFAPAPNAAAPAPAPAVGTVAPPSHAVQRSAVSAGGGRKGRHIVGSAPESSAPAAAPAPAPTSTPAAAPASVPAPAAVAPNAALVTPAKTAAVTSHLPKDLTNLSPRELAHRNKINAQGSSMSNAPRPLEQKTSPLKIV